MSFDSNVQKATADMRVLVQLDISQDNIQWVNIGAGIWKVNAENLYPFVDASLLTGFTAQDFGTIGSVYSDGVALTKVETLLLISTTLTSFYYDPDARDLYVRFVNSDEPWLHQNFIGVVSGFSFDEFTPIDSDVPYQGRLLSVPNISKSRDPLFWGRIQFNGGTVSLANADGEFDTFGQDGDIYGNPCRIFFGYDDISIDDYVQIYTGNIGPITISEETMQVQVEDKRAQLTKAIKYNATSENGVTSIQNILTDNFDIAFNSTFFDTAAWETARAIASTNTIDMQTAESAIQVIEQICTSQFGVFDITPEGKYTFKMINVNTSVVLTIQDYEISNTHRLTYPIQEVITSVKVGYNKDWTTSASPYTYFTNTDFEDESFAKYKTYREQTINTFLRNLSEATSYGSVIMTYFKDVHATEPIQVPMKYYNVDVGDFIRVHINRATTPMLGSTKVEVMAKSFDLNNEKINFKIRL